MKKLLIIASVTLIILIGCTSSFAQTLAPISPETYTPPPQRGLHITAVLPNSPAAVAGLRLHDVLTKYGEYEIVDDARYFEAKNHYHAAHTPTVEIVVWRRGTLFSVQVPSGWLGVMSEDQDKTSQEFWALMKEINDIREASPYLLERGDFYHFKGTQQQDLLKAKELVDRGEREKTLTPGQVLLYRISMIMDDAPAEDLQRLENLLQQLIASQPTNYIDMIGNDKFFKGKRYRAAIACFKERLKRSSDDVSVRLNLGVSYNEVGMYSEAIIAADYVFENKLELGEHGELVGYQVKATASLGLQDYRDTIEYAKKAFSLDPSSYNNSLILLAAAETGDLELLEETVQQFQRASPQEYERRRVHYDAVMAYALTKTNQTEAARKLVMAWKNVDNSAGRVTAFWRTVPHGSRVSRVFGELMKG